MTEHWLDSNVFITLKNGPYAFDIAPGFWDLVERKHVEGVLRTSLLVFQELVEHTDDELARWLRQRRSVFSIEPNAGVQAAFKQIADYVNSSFGNVYAAPFLGGADPWVIAHARECGGTVVTFESRVPVNSRKVKIPNICDQFNVPSIDPWRMLRVIGASFH